MWAKYYRRLQYWLHRRHCHARFHHMFAVTKQKKTKKYYGYCSEYSRFADDADYMKFVNSIKDVMDA